MQANKRIDGLYVFVAPPSLDVLAERARGRLKEAESTIQARLEWANAQVNEVSSLLQMSHLPTAMRSSSLFDDLRVSLGGEESQNKARSRL